MSVSWGKFGIPVLFRRWLILALIVPTSAIHRLALSLDAWLFRGLSEQPVTRPLFVVGLPRSGTTLLHRLILSQPGFTAFPLWELLFAPALCEKYLVWWLFRVDCLLGGPMQSSLRWLQSRWTSSFDSIHPTGLSDPEEDYLGLLPFDLCFLRVLVWPHSEATWRLCYPRRMTEADRKRFLQCYRALLVRHLRFRGPHLQLVSKNPSLTGWLPELVQQFPDARFIGLRRTPAEAVPSQLSSLDGGLELFGNRAVDPQIVERFVTLLARYWQTLDRASQTLETSRFQLIGYRALIDSPYETVVGCLSDLGYKVSNAAELRRQCAAGSHFRSKHRYSLSEYGLTEEQIESTFFSSGAQAPASGSAVTGCDAPLNKENSTSLDVI